MILKYEKVCLSPDEETSHLSFLFFFPIFSLFFFPIFFYFLLFLTLVFIPFSLSFFGLMLDFFYCCSHFLNKITI